MNEWTFTSRVVRPDDVTVECTLTIPVKAAEKWAIRDGAEIAQMGAANAMRAYLKGSEDEQVPF